MIPNGTSCNRNCNFDTDVLTTVSRKFFVAFDFTEKLEQFKLD